MNTPELRQGGEENPWEAPFGGFVTSDEFEAMKRKNPLVIALSGNEGKVAYPRNQFYPGEQGDLIASRTAVELWHHGDVQALVNGDPEIQWMAAQVVLSPKHRAEYEELDARPPNDVPQQFIELHDTVVSEIGQLYDARFGTTVTSE